MSSTENHWTTPDTCSPEEWLWGWVEYLGSAGAHSSDICQAAEILSVLPGNVAECYEGEWDTDVNFAKEGATEQGLISGTWPYSCVDWEWSAKDLMMEFASHNSHYFRMV